MMKKSTIKRFTPPLSNLKKNKLFFDCSFLLAANFRLGWKGLSVVPLHLLFLFILFIAFRANIYSQSEILVNKTWGQAFGAPEDYEWAKSVLDNTGNLVTTGHTTIDQNNTKLVLVKQDPNGDILWQKDFQLSENTKNGGVTIAIDENDNIIVGGVTSASGNTSDFDFLILKYGSDGEIIWDQTFDGPGNGIDVPTAIVIEDDQVFICGPSEGDNTGIDYWIFKLDSSDGNQEWEERYDFSGLDDYPADMTLDDSGNLVITGTSAVSSLNWEMATVIYDASSGDLLDEERIGNETLGIFQPSGLAKTPDGDFVISGITATAEPSFNTNIRTVKLTPSLGLVWMKDYDSGAMTDSVSAVVADQYGGVVVTGWRSNGQHGAEFLTLRYQSNGTLDWARIRTAASSNTVSKVRAALVDANDQIIIAGGSKNKLILTQYTLAGEVMWEKEIETPTASSNQPVSLLLNQDGEIFLASIVKSIEGKTYSTSKFTRFTRPQNVVFDEQNEPSHLKGEIIVRFKPGVIKTSFIDNTDLRYGTAREAFQDLYCLETMADILSANDFSDWNLVKIHRNRTTADSLATTRLGKAIKVPDFYNTLVLLVPKEYNTIEGEFAISDSLESEDLLCCIRYAETNRIVTLDDDCEPNDPLYQTQGNLHPTEDYPDGHINMEPAWCIAGGGSSSVKVSIIDSGIRWSHEDYGDGTFSGSVIIDGKDYGTGAHISTDNNNDNTDHGTRVASVIGSIRNNAIGVAGTAGGSGSADGVRLIAQKALYPGLAMAVDKMIEAFGDAVDEYQVQVINCSGGYDDPVYSLSDQDIALREKLHYANRMGVIICASRGNSPSGGEPTNTRRYPGTAQDEWVLCVGGTGTDGNYNPECRFGWSIDIAAPSRWQLTRSAQNYIPGTSQASDQAYGGISFTSGATPHVAGLAALMVGYYEAAGIQLVQEDIEYIIQASATDVFEDPAIIGYDAYTGYGIINAGAALQMIEQPMCNVYHFGTDANPHSKTDQLVGENVIVELNEPFTTEEGQVFDKGIYSADVYKVTATVTHPLPANAQLTHFWERHSSSTVFELYGASGGQNILEPVEHVEIIGTPTQNTAMLEGYVYYLKNSSCSIEGWMPASPENAQLTYSLIGCLTTGTKEAVAHSLKLFPNPTSGQVSVSLPQGANWDNFSALSVLDFSGRQVMAAEGIEMANQNQAISLDVSHLPSGVYTCVFRGGAYTLSANFVKL